MSNIPPSSDDPAQGVPRFVPPTSDEMSPEDLAKLLMTSGMAPSPESAPGGLSGKGSLRKKLLVASLIAAVGLGASIMSCIGQSFSYRQAHAMEGIEQHLKGIRTECSAGTPIQPTRKDAP